MQPLSVGLVGYGGFGAFLHHAWNGTGGVAVRAVADADPSRRPADVRFYTRWQDLVADAGVDLVAIATPPASHAEIACAAMEAGKHVLVEKPLATTHADALRIRDARDRTGRVAAVDYMMRFNPVVEALHAWARSGCFGRLRRVVVENYAQDESLGPGHWFWDPAASGGILVEHAVHFIDVVHGCTAARPVRVDGIALRRGTGQEDRVMATVVYEDGLVASHFHAFSRPGFFEQTTQRFVFDLAQVDVEGWIPLSGRVSALVASGTETSGTETSGTEASGTESELNRLPGFTPARRAGLDALPDVSRPEGWGDVPRGDRRLIRSGGEPYTVDALVEGTFAVPTSKSVAYADALRALMRDVAAAVRAPSHRLRAGLEEGLSSLSVALAATEAAHAR